MNMSADKTRTKQQLIQELAGLRGRVAELETADTERKRVRYANAVGAVRAACVGENT